MKLVDAAKIIFYASAGMVFLALASAILDVRDYAVHDLKPMIKARDAQVAALLTTVDKTSKKNAENIDVTLTNIKALTGDADDSIEQITGALLDDKFGLIPRAGNLVQTLNDIAIDADKATVTLNAEILKTGAFAREQLSPLSDDLKEINCLLKNAQQQIAENGTASQTTLAALTKTLDDADKLVADPHIAETIAHVDGSAESIDIALRPWRKKAALLKKILGAVGQAVLNNAAFLLK